ncbi:hypothetical protein [Xanthomonas phage NEB7]|nr:hypothetical protein [Xanthomonas phage NEB7]
MNAYTQEPMWTVEQAAQWLPGVTLDRGTLSRLGKDCSLVVRIWKRPTGVVPVVGKAWSSEKSYTRDVLIEAFSRHPATRAAMVGVQSRNADRHWRS